MKTITKKLLSFFLILGLFLPVFAASNKKQYVSVTTAAVKAKASQFASSVGELKYGDEVSVVSTEKTWSKITSIDGSVTGWLPNSSLTTKKLIVEVQSKKKTSANATELALAGKGFDTNFENTFEKANDVNFADVDKVESFSASEKETLSFITEGQLFAGEQ